MGGILLLCGFLVCGVVIADALFSRKSAFIRLWLGLCMGLMLLMWLPVPFAYAMTFNLGAQLLALLCAALLAAGLSIRCGRFRLLRSPSSMIGETGFFGGMPAWLPAVLVLPMTLLFAYLLWTHTIQPQDGALHVGQSTYGDLCLHLGIATGTRNAAFPPDYTILPGALLGYPFLADTMVTSLLLCGGGLASSFVVTGTIMGTLVFAGFVIFAWELTRKPAAVVIAFVLMFFNGGLGFLYHLDGVFKNPEMFKNIFTGFYQTPTNMPELNLRWVNVICDMMIPQRTLLTGWMVLLPALYMLLDAIRERKASRFLLLGVWAGLMPMVHTHSFFALGLMSVGLMLHQIIREREDKRGVFIRFLIYGVIAVAIAAPQLLTWTFPQTIGGTSSSGSLSLRFNWVNNQGNGQLIDGYFWFWIKNVGLAYIFMLPAALSAKRGSMMRGMAAGALVIYAVAELVQFQPNPYDNNKLFYVAYMLMLPAVASFLLRVYERLRGIPCRRLAAAGLAVACTLSGALSICREVVSDYQLFGADEVEAAEYIEENLPEKALFLTGDQHNNAVAALTGRYIVCGTGSYLYYHGMDYSAQANAMRSMLKNPGENQRLFEEYGVDYIYISSNERHSFEADEGWFAENCYLIFDNGGVQIYAYSEEAFSRSSAQIVAAD